MDQLFETKDQVKEFIVACIKDFVSEKAASEKAQKARDAEAAEKQELKDTLKEVSDAMKSLKEDVDVLKGKTPERNADASGDEDVDKSTGEGSTDGDDKTDENDVFKGLFFDPEAIKQLEGGTLQ